MKSIILLLTVFFLVMLYNIKAPAQEKVITHKSSLRPVGKRIIPHVPRNGPTAIKNTVANGNWSSGSTWNGGTVPNSGDDITIMNNVTLDIVDSTISTGTLTINAGFTLTLNSETNLYIGSTASISGTLLVIAGSDFGTWVYPAGNFTINSGGTFNCSASNTHCDFYGTTQTFTNNGTITSPLNDLSLDNSGSLTLAGTGSIVVTSLNTNTGNLSNSALHNVTISSGGMLNRGDGTIAVTPLGTLYDLMYSNTTAINSGPESQNNAVIRDLTMNGFDNVTLNSDATVNGNFIILGGNLNISTRILTLNGGIQAGGFFGTLTGGATSKLTLGGSGSITLPDIQTQQLNTLIINRSANDQITLGGNLKVTNTLEIDNGNINTDIYNLTLGTTGTNLGTLIYNAGANTGIITGKFTRWFGTSTTQPVTKFPVGDVNVYSKPRMVTIQYGTTSGNRPTTAGTLTVQYITGDPINLNNVSLNDGGYSVDTYSRVGYWQITPTTLAGGTYSISISPSRFIGILTPAQLRILKRPSAGTLWTLQGAHVPGTSTPDTTASRSGLLTSGGFGQFGIGGNFPDNPLDAPMPVELSSFSSSVNSNNVKLTWITASETNNQGFEIYRKSEQSDWTKIGFVEGSGTVSTPKTYTYNDNGLSTNKYFYELKQIDYNGTYKFFVMLGYVTIETPKKFTVSQNYPNPFNPVTRIDYNLPLDSKVIIKIYDINGKEIKTLVNKAEPAGFHSVSFDGNEFSSGMYFYRVFAGAGGQNFEVTKKMLLIK